MPRCLLDENNLKRVVCTCCVANPGETAISFGWVLVARCFQGFECWLNSRVCLIAAGLPSRGQFMSEHLSLKSCKSEPWKNPWTVTWVICIPYFVWFHKLQGLNHDVYVIRARSESCATWSWSSSPSWWWFWYCTCARSGSKVRWGDTAMYISEVRFKLSLRLFKFKLEVGLGAFGVIWVHIHVNQ